jgi:hypothetical protein
LCRRRTIDFGKGCEQGGSHRLIAQDSWCGKPCFDRPARRPNAVALETAHHILHVHAQSLDPLFPASCHGVAMPCCDVLAELRVLPVEHTPIIAELSRHRAHRWQLMRIVCDALKRVPNAQMVKRHRGLPG